MFSRSASGTAASSALKDMASLTSPSPPVALGSLTKEEAASAFANLSQADLIRVEAFARGRARGLGAATWEDLVQESIARTLAGSRHWPRQVSAVVYLRQTIRSLAEEARRQQIEFGILAGGESDRLAAQAPAELPDVEAAISARQELLQIQKLFEGDAHVMALIDGLNDGETAAQTQTKNGMSAAEHEAARKRFRRGISAWSREDRR